MIPRLSSSNKWTTLPPELKNQIREVFSENFAPHAANGKFHVDGRIYSQELLLRVGYLENGRLRQANFEASLDFDPKKQNALSQIHLAIDCVASLIHDYFEAEQDLTEFPETWSVFEAEKKKIFVQVTTVNTDLESEADRLLGEAGVDLVQGSDEEDLEADRKAVVTMLGLNDEDLEEVPHEDGAAKETATEEVTKNSPKTKTKTTPVPPRAGGKKNTIH